MGVSGESLADLIKDLDNQSEDYQPALDFNSIPNFKYESQLDKALSWANQGSVEQVPFPIDVFLSNLPCVFVVRRDDLGDISGYIEQQSDGWEIGLNAYHADNRQRFTLAHELGHLLFHREYLKLQEGSRYEEQGILWRSSLFNKIETEANNFASELLMPKQRFVKEWNSKNENNLECMSGVFKTSTQAIRYRAYRLGLVNEY